jgi:membrane protein
VTAPIHDHPRVRNPGLGADRSTRHLAPPDRPPPGGARVPVLVFLRRLVIRSFRAFLDDGAPHLAGSIAYRVIFSLVPLAIVLTAVFGIVLSVTGLRADVVDTIVDNLPLSADGAAQMRDLLEGATGSRSGLGLIALVGLVWAASGMMGAIRYALNRAWNVDRQRPFVRGKAIDVFLVFCVSILVLLSLALTIAARFLERHASGALDAVGIPGVVASWGLGVLVPLLLAFASVLFLYRVVPAVSPSLSELWPAALFVALVFGLLQNLFAVYLRHFGNYNAVYGSLGAVFAFLFFVYISTLVLLFGAEIAAHWRGARETLERRPVP